MIAKWVGVAIVVVTFILTMTVSWRRWADVLIDFGRELYVPWRIMQGDVPHRDLAVFFGPLSSYVNALWFTLFGPSLVTLALSNAALLAMFTTFLYWLVLKVAGLWSAIVGCVAFLMVFAFGHLQGMANYNFICPYSHELPHGTMLGMICIAIVARHFRTGHTMDASIAGIALGLVFLTKSEPFVATLAAVAIGWVGQFALRRTHVAVQVKPLFIMGISALAPPVAACIALATAMPIEQAARATLGSWVFVGNVPLRELPFYRFIMGTTKPGANLLAMITWTGWIVAALGPAFVVSVMIQSQPARLWLWSTIVTAVGAAALWWSSDNFAWEHTARPLPLIMLVAIVVAGSRLWRNRHHVAVSTPALPRLMLLVFALAMLLKMILNARYGHYGFALAMPATVMGIAIVMDWVPAWLSHRGRAGWLFRAWTLGVIVVWLVAMQRYNLWNASETIDVGSGADRFEVDATRGEVVNELLTFLESHTPPDAPIAVMPEGVMINYLSRRRNGTAYFNFLPPEMLMFGEQRIADALAANPPDYIALVQRDMPEYGLAVFGRDYGQQMRSWIEANYRPVRSFGEEPELGRHSFAIWLLMRNEIANDSR
jgi:hypothetical protein